MIELKSIKEKGDLINICDMKLGQVAKVESVVREDRRYKGEIVVCLFDSINNTKVVNTLVPNGKKSPYAYNDWSLDDLTKVRVLTGDIILSLT